MTSDDEPTERLAAILAADAAGYSRLMRTDERRTVATLDEYRGVFRDAIAQHGGRVVDMAGDSVLAVFASVGGAVASAIEIQASLAQRNATRAPDHAMEFRIGINLGDILEKSDGSIYGDGVNVAARLESLAVPGGINVSGSVYDSVRPKISAAFEFIGEQALKNITNPVSVYRLLPAADEPGTATPRLTQPGPAATAAVPKVAVTPFTVISGDVGIESLAAGLYQDIVRGLTTFGRPGIACACRSRSSTRQRIGSSGPNATTAFSTTSSISKTKSRSRLLPPCGCKSRHVRSRSFVTRTMRPCRTPSCCRRPPAISSPRVGTTTKPRRRSMPCSHANRTMRWRMR